MSESGTIESSMLMQSEMIRLISLGFFYVADSVERLNFPSDFKLVKKLTIEGRQANLEFENGSYILEPFDHLSSDFWHYAQTAFGVIKLFTFTPNGGLSPAVTLMRAEPTSISDSHLQRDEVAKSIHLLREEQSRLQEERNAQGREERLTFLRTTFVGRTPVGVEPYAKHDDLGFVFVYDDGSRVTVVRVMDDEESSHLEVDGHEVEQLF